jgi:hypothetical protein
LLLLSRQRRHKPIDLILREIWYYTIPQLVGTERQLGSYPLVSSKEIALLE